MKIIVTAKMGPGTFSAKFEPLSKVEKVEKIFVLRKTVGPKINKVEYILLPKICKIKLFNFMITPIMLTFYSKKKNIDLILSYHFIPHAFFAYFASIFSKRPFIVSQTGLLIQKYAHKKFFKILIKIVLRKAYYLNVPGNSSRKYWVNLGISKKKIQLLHSSIDTNKFKQEKTEKIYDFIFVGRLNYIKQIHLIINAFSNLVQENSNLRLLIVGKGELTEKLQKQVSTLKLNNNVVFSGFQKKIRILLNKSRIFVMTSKSEGLPCALMEAMSCGLLVIAPDVGNISDILIDNRTGFLLRNTHLNLITSTMRKALSGYNSFHIIRKRAREIINKDHSCRSAEKKWEKLLGILSSNNKFK